MKTLKLETEVGKTSEQRGKSEETESSHKTVTSTCSLLTSRASPASCPRVPHSVLATTSGQSWMYASIKSCPGTQNNPSNVTKRFHWQKQRRKRCKKTGTDREGGWNGEKRRVSVSCLQRACSPLPGFSYLLTLLLLGTFYQPNIWHPGNETQQSAVFVVRLGTAGTNPTDSTSLLWYSEYISEPVLYYFCWSKEVESVLLLL